MPTKKKHLDFLAFCIFGFADNFPYVVMLSAADDIIRRQNGLLEDASNSTTHCFENLGKPRCAHLMSTGAVLLANIVPTLCIKFTFPFFMNRIPFGFRHFLVCFLQALSFLIVAFSTSVPMSLFGVVITSISSGLGEICYLALSAHYSQSTISAWCSGTGGAGLIGALAYAALTEPKLFGLSSKNALLSMLIVTIIFVMTYWFLLTPSPTVHRMHLFDVSTWLVPTQKNPIVTNGKHMSSVNGENAYQMDGNCATSDDHIENLDTSSHEFTLIFKLRHVIPLLRYMIPMSVVYFAEYLINSGLYQLIHFDCAHGFWLAIESQFRWFQALYQLGVFTSRSSFACLQLPSVALYILPILQCLNLILFYFQVLGHFVPHIALVFGLIFVEGLFGGASYVNTFHQIRKEAPPEVREFSMSIASSADCMGISVSAVCAILLHNYICQLYPRIYP